MPDIWQPSIELAFSAATSLVAMPMAWLIWGMEVLAWSITQFASLSSAIRRRSYLRPLGSPDQASQHTRAALKMEILHDRNCC